MQISNFFDWQYSDGYKKTATEFANALWDILNHAENYSFEKDPLPIFYLLHAAYCDYEIDFWGNGISMKSSDLTYPSNSTREKLLNSFPEDCTNSLCQDCETFESFCMLLNSSYTDYCDSYGYDFHYIFRGAIYKYIHPFIVEFFVQKFIQSHKSEYELSESFINKIWERINDYEDSSSNCYIPYAGLSSIALHDINNPYTTTRVGYNCEENDPLLSLISKIRLCAYGHNPGLIKTSSEIVHDGFDFGPWGTPDIHMVSVPPFGLKIKKENSNGEIINIDVAEDLITKFLEDNRLNSAYLVLPLNFAREPKLKNIRQKLIEGKLIKSIDLIPEGSFISSSTAGILICLNKKNDSDTIKLVFEEGIYKDVTYDEIVNNDFILNPNLYFSNTKTDEAKFSYHLNRVIWEPSPIPTGNDNQENTNITSDLIHCLGPIFNRINCAIDVNSDNEDFKLIKDNISYMTRVIKSFGADFSSYRTNKEEIGVNDFFQEYYSSLQNCNSSIYKIEYSSKLSDDTTFEVDEDVMRIMLDTILDNAYRHGFKKAKNIDARVGISTSCKRIKGKDFILIEVANNGLPFPNDLTFEKFISRGEFCGENGHTGLGGNHIYNIIKLHGGYLNITKSAKWNIIFDILIPIEYISDEDMDNITDYDNEDWCA